MDHAAPAAKVLPFAKVRRCPAWKRPPLTLDARRPPCTCRLTSLHTHQPWQPVVVALQPSEELAARQNLFSRHLKEVQRVEDALVEVMSRCVPG